MMRNSAMKNLIGTLAIILVSNSGFASFGGSSKGTTTANFLKLGAGARGVAMGEAYTAVTDDANSMYWNPGALTQIEKNSVTLMHDAYIDSSFYDYGAYGRKLNDKSAFGAAFQYFSAGSIDTTDTHGNTTGSFTPSDMSVALGYAHEFGGYSFGIAAKYIQSKIVDTAKTEAVDLGILSPWMWKEKLRLGAAAANIGGKMKFESESEDIPMIIRVGGVYKILDGWLFSLDGNFPRDNDPYVAAGTEYAWKLSNGWGLAARAGYNSQTTGDVGGFTGATFGFGVAFSKVSIDYGFQPFGNVGITNLVSVNFKF